MKKLSLGPLIVYFGVTLLALGCDRPPSQPEIGDPILSSIQKDISFTKERIGITISKVEKTEKELSETHPHDLLYTVHKDALEGLQKELSFLRQRLRFFEIKQGSRISEVRKKALDSWKAGAKYDPSDDLRDYLSKREYEEMPRSWDERIPNPNDALTEFLSEERSAVEKRKEDRRKAAGL